MKVRYRGDADTDQVRWGSNDDPRGVLIPEGVYAVERVEVHSWHTKYWIAGRAYNSVHFDPVGATPDGPLDALKPEFLRIAAEVGLSPALTETVWELGQRHEALTKYGWQPAAVRAMLQAWKDTQGDTLLSYADFCRFDETP